MGVEWGNTRNGSIRGRQSPPAHKALLSPAKDADETSSQWGEATHLYEHSAASYAALSRLTRRTRRLLVACGHDPGA